MKSWLYQIFLGPNATFRNGHRTWLYLGFVGLTILAMAWLRHQGS